MYDNRNSIGEKVSTISRGLKTGRGQAFKGAYCPNSGRKFLSSFFSPKSYDSAKPAENASVGNFSFFCQKNQKSGVYETANHF